MPHEALLSQMHERLRVEADAERIVTIRTNVSVPRAPGAISCVPRQRWFTIIDPDADLITRARKFADALASVPRVRAQMDGAL